MSEKAFLAFFVRPACISAYPFSNSSLNSASDNVLMSTGLQKALDLLPEIQREVVILRYYHDLKVKDIATITGVGVSTVQSRIYQGLRKLEKVLEREEFL